MKKNIFVALCVTLFLSCATKHYAGSSKEPLPKYKIEDFLNIEENFAAGYSPDFKEFIYISNKSGVFNVWLYDIKNKTANILIASKETIRRAFWNKINNKIYYTQDIGGNENFNVFEFDRKNKKSQKILGNKDTTVQIINISRDFSKLYYLENKRDKKAFDLYSYDFKNRSQRQIWKNTTTFALVHFIEKTDKIILSELLGDERNNLYIYDLKTKKQEPLFTDGMYSYSVEDDDVDGNFLYITSNMEGEFYEGYKLNLKTKKMVKILPSKWDVVAIGRTFNKKYYYYMVNENGSYVLNMFSDEFKTKIETPNLEAGQIMIQTLDRDEKHVAFKFDSDATPSDIYLWEIGSKDVTKITNNLSANVKSEHLVSSIPVTYKTRDGLPIHGFLYLPKQPMPKEGFPVIMNIHGGPKSQSTPYFSGSTQFLVNNGIAVFFPNVRGSTGYGKSFHMMDNKDFGGKPLLDVIDGKNYLAGRDEIDPNRIGIMGGSYGGYMVLAALAFQPKEFKVGVDIVGPSNLVTLIKSFPPYWTDVIKYIYDEFGDPAKDEKYMLERSPLFAADKIERPLIIFHGRNDVRVKLSEAETIYEAVKKKNGIVELHIYDDEGHGFRKKHNIEDYLNKTMIFLQKYL